MPLIIATLACLHPTADVVVAVDMTEPRRTPRLIPLRKPLAAPAQWPRIGDEMRAGAQPVGESGFTLWLLGTRRFGKDAFGGPDAWSPSGKYLMTRWFHGKGTPTTLRIFDRNGRLLATRRSIDRAAYWSYRGDALIMRQASGKRTVWSRGHASSSVANGNDRMDEVYRTLTRTIAKAEGASMKAAEDLLIYATLNSVIGAATYVRSRIIEIDHATHVDATLYWCGPDASWSRPLDEDEGGFVPVAGGWVCGTGHQKGRSTLLLLKEGSRLVVPTPGDVEDRPPLYVH